MNSKLRISLHTATVVIVAGLLYLAISQAKREDTEAASTTEPSHTISTTTGVSADRVMLVNGLSEDWSIELKLPSIGEKLVIERRKWMLDDPTFYFESLNGQAVMWEINDAAIKNNVDNILASTTGRQNFQTELSSEIIRLGQLREDYVSSKLQQSKTYENAKLIYKSPTYTPETIDTFLGTYTTAIDILNQQIRYIDLLILVNKKLFEGIKTRNAGLVIASSGDDVLLRAAAAWYEKAFSTVTTRQNNLQLDLVQKNLNALSGELETLSKQASSSSPSQ